MTLELGAPHYLRCESVRSGTIKLNRDKEMSILTNNGVDGKVCSTCHRWKPLDDFPRDRTHGPLQGGGTAAAKHAIARPIARAKPSISNKLFQLRAKLGHASTGSRQSPIVHEI